MADKLLGLKYTDWTTKVLQEKQKAKQAAKEAEKTKVKDTVASYPATHPLTSYTGVFENKGYGKFQVKMVYDSLMTVQSLRPVYLRHKTYDIYDLLIKNKNGFDTSDVTPARFEMDNNGSINKLVIELESGVKPIVFERVPEMKPVPKDSLKKYVGSYELAPGAIAKIYIKSDSILYAFIQGQPEYELMLIDINKFNIKILSGYNVQFNANAAGKITELLFIQPNGTFKATKKEE